jgi:hypothetical protein
VHRAGNQKLKGGIKMDLTHDKIIRLDGITCFCSRCYGVRKLKTPLLGLRIVRGETEQVKFTHEALVFNPKNGADHPAGTYQLWLPARPVASGGGREVFEVVVPRLDNNTSKLFVSGEIGKLITS